jgi:L-asparaginase
MESQHIHILITGGTIDSVFDPSSDSILVNDRSVVQEYIEKTIKAHFKVTSEVICLKDSRQITDATRQDMVYAIQRAPSDNVIITHGTYTMPQTAEYLAKHTELFPLKKIVLFGAFFPLRGFADSDAPFNLGFALASVLTSAPGVYLAMNGRLFLPGQVCKNVAKARFEPI